jgi:radical SAM protein with 4Fe4S-binding SPASM domain
MNSIADSGRRRHAEAYLRRRIDPSASYADLIDFPRYFEIETVNTCNARCTMCTIEDWDRPLVRMSDELFAKIARELGNHRDTILGVSLYKDCEPLIDKKLPERIALLKELAVPHVGISTNVSLLDEEKGTALLQAGIDTVLLSIDSLRKDVYEKIRIRLDFETVIENAVRFIRLRDRINPRTSIRVRMIDLPENKGEWESYRAFWQPKLQPHDKCDIHHYHNWGGQLDGFQGPFPAYDDLPCITHWSNFVIFASGDVPLCAVDFKLRYPTGNVRDSSIKELWTSPLMQQRRLLHLTAARGENPLCRTCNVWDDRTAWDAAGAAER